ncbi:MAG: hypothetical protein LBU47_02940 [Christensenellaceae bacterium]|jgi:hypothetical protein|nr:hypothetical protein [Christensenellaceae bacterium]
MEFHRKLPRNRLEFALFMAIVSILSVNIIAPLITCFEFGFSLGTYGNVLRVLPVLWLVVIALVLLTHKPAEWLSAKIVSKGDSFRATVKINALCAVFLLSILLTVIGAWIGSGRLSMEPILGFFHKWPRNFAIALFVEIGIAQPAARFVMLKVHGLIDEKARKQELLGED